jgi:hypothetical protein
MVCLCTVPAGMLTFWLSRGRGTMGAGQTTGSTFYALLSTGEHSCSPTQLSNMMVVPDNTCWMCCLC